MREFRREVLDRSSEGKSIDTYFTDSSELISPFMNSVSSRNGLTFGKNVSFLGRSGIKILKDGLRVAYISGLDCDMLGAEVINADPQTDYLGNYLVKSDIDVVLE